MLPLNRWTFSAAAAAVAIGLVLASAIWHGRITDQSSVSPTPVHRKAVDALSSCASQATYDALKREVFRRAGEMRRDQQAYTRLADIAYIRVDRPVVRAANHELRTFSCSGTAVVSLSPAVAQFDARRPLSGEVDYTVFPAADNTGDVVRLDNADEITIALANLSPKAIPGGAAAPKQNAETTKRSAAVQIDAHSTSSSPRFDCNRTRTDTEAAVCSQPDLARLDNELAAQLKNASSEADADQRRLLDLTQIRFVSRRAQCASNDCIANSYRSRSREINDIMSGHWRG